MCHHWLCFICYIEKKGEAQMITIFNRKKLLVTMDMDKQAHVRSVLSNANIAYKRKVRNVRNTSFPDPHARVLHMG